MTVECLGLVTIECIDVGAYTLWTWVPGEDGVGVTAASRTEVSAAQVERAGHSRRSTLTP